METKNGEWDVHEKCGYPWYCHWYAKKYLEKSEWGDEGYAVISCPKEIVAPTEKLKDAQ